MLCKVTLGVLKDASKLNVLLLLPMVERCVIFIREMVHETDDLLRCSGDQLPAAVPYPQRLNVVTCQTQR